MELACDAGSVRILSGSFPAEGGLDPSTALWLTDYDPAQWAEIAAAVDAGRDPNEVYRPQLG